MRWSTDFQSSQSSKRSDVHSLSELWGLSCGWWQPLSLNQLQLVPGTRSLFGHTKKSRGDIFQIHRYRVSHICSSHLKKIFFFLLCVRSWLQHTGSLVVGRRLSCSAEAMWDLSSLTRNWTAFPPALKVWVLTTGLPGTSLLQLIFFKHWNINLPLCHFLFAPPYLF